MCRDDGECLPAANNLQNAAGSLAQRQHGSEMSRQSVSLYKREYEAAAAKRQAMALGFGT